MPDLSGFGGEPLGDPLDALEQHPDVRAIVDFEALAHDMDSPFGQLLLRKLKADVNDALHRLLHVDPTDTAAVMFLQLRIEFFSGVAEWISRLREEARKAEQRIREEEGPLDD